MKWLPIAESHFRANCCCGQTTKLFSIYLQLHITMNTADKLVIKVLETSPQKSDCLVSTSQSHCLWNDLDQMSTEILYKIKSKITNISYAVKEKTTDWCEVLLTVNLSRFISTIATELPFWFILVGQWATSQKVLGKHKGHLRSQGRSERHLKACCQTPGQYRSWGQLSSSETRQHSLPID